MKLGNANVNKIRLGSTQMKRVYLGSDIVWQNAPTAIAATGVGTTSFTAEWEAYSGATFYLLDVSESSDFSTFIYQNQIVEAPTTSYVIIGVESNTTYYYRVRAGDGALPFQFSVKTDNAGVSSSTQFRMPLTTSTGLNFDVDWGDGSATENITDHTLAIHTYPIAGTYTITVTGSILGWQFGNGKDKLKMLNVNAWGSLNISVSQGFRGCTNLTATATDAPIISTNSLEAYFRDCPNFNGDIGNWDISNVSRIDEMFYDCSAFNKNLGSWNVANVLLFTNTFFNATAFNNGNSADINNWTLSSTGDLNMTGMFGGSNTTISCKFNQPIGNWNTSRVTNMTSLFANNNVFNQDIRYWNTSRVTSMLTIFNRASLFNQDISTKIVNVGQPNEYVAWDVSKVTNFQYSFILAVAFNANISNWDVSSAIIMRGMFYGCSAFNQNLGSWNVANVTDFREFMEDKTAADYSAANLDSIYNGWSSLPSLSPNESISFGSIKYTAAGAIGKNRLLNSPNNWVISDGGQNEPFQFTVKTDNAGVSTSTQFRMPLTTSTNLGFTVNWGDGVTETITDHTLAVHDYGVAGTYTISVTGSILGWSFAGGGDRLKMLNVLKWSGLNISTNSGFYGCTNLTATATDAPLITSTSLSQYFRGCTNFNGEIGNWDVSNITNFVEMFRDASAFNNGGSANINNWTINTTSIVNMGTMFGNASSFNQNIGSWDVSSVTTFTSFASGATAFNNGGSSDINNWNIRTASAVNMADMFGGSNTTTSCKFNQPIGNWNTSAVTDMSLMFGFNTAFNQNIGAWNTSSVTNMSSMFKDTRYTGFNQDIGGWNVSNVTNFSNMFLRSSFANLNSPSLNNWVIRTNAFVTMGNMFQSCPFNQPIGSWNTSMVNNMNFMFAYSGFNQDIGSWNVSNVTDFGGFMNGRTAANYSAQNLASIYNQWSQLTLKPNITIDFSTIDYCDTAEANKQSIVTNFGWNITDGNAVPC